MMAVGSMHDLFREGMRQLFLKSVRFRANGSKTSDWEQQLRDPHGIDREFIVVSHSLGSYLVFSTLNMDQHESVLQDAHALSSKIGSATEDNAAQYILERTSLVYFFANQVPLLELANTAGPTARLGLLQGLVPGQALGVMNNLMAKWENMRETFARRSTGSDQAIARPAQVIAWSDPSDLLSWHLPAMEGLAITNLYVRNTWWHWIIANPAAAHGNYATNKEVLRIMFGPRESAAQ
jgi:pimeloyl-ACP methyl ester carboxylesterase